MIGKIVVIRRDNSDNDDNDYNYYVDMLTGWGKYHYAILLLPQGINDFKQLIQKLDKGELTYYFAGDYILPKAIAEAFEQNKITIVAFEPLP